LHSRFVAPPTDRVRDRPPQPPPTFPFNQTGGKINSATSRNCGKSSRSTLSQIHSSVSK
jgi:hypothetical protein